MRIALSEELKIGWIRGEIWPQKFYSAASFLLLHCWLSRSKHLKRPRDLITRPMDLWIRRLTIQIRLLLRGCWRSPTGWDRFITRNPATNATRIPVSGGSSQVTVLRVGHLDANGHFQNPEISSLMESRPSKGAL